MSCNQCNGRFGVQPSCFPGWDLLACQDCGRPIRLVSQTLSRLSSQPRLGRRDLNRALRAKRRKEMAA